MIARPTTQQLLDDCAREVRDTLMPIVDNPAVRVRLEMLEQLLSSCAVRAAHEMAWMAEECEQLERFAADVAAVFPDADEVSAALDEYRRAAASPTGSSLHLDDRVCLYDLAGQAFGAALEARHGKRSHRAVGRGQGGHPRPGRPRGRLPARLLLPRPLLTRSSYSNTACDWTVEATSLPAGSVRRVSTTITRLPAFSTVERAST